MNAFRAMPASAGSGGAGRFFDALLLGLADRVRLRVLASEANRSGLPAHKRIEYVVVPEESQDALWPHFEWADIYYDPLNGLRPVLIPSRLPVAVAIMDLQHNVFPEYFPGGMYETRNREYGYAITRASGVITISHFEKQNIERIYGVDNVHVVYLTGYLAESGPARPAGKAQVARPPYLIFPAVPWRHKNHYMLIEALGVAHRHAEMNGASVRLLLTGLQSHGSSTNTYQWKIAAEGAGPHVETMAHLPEAEFSTLMRNARGLVFPSLYEGYGIPVVDALKLGVPVLTTREAAIPEVAGDAVMYFRDPHNSLTMAEDLCRFWNDEGMRKQLAAEGLVQGAKFSNDRFVRETLEALVEIRESHNAVRPPALSIRPPNYDEVQERKALGAIVLVEPRHGSTIPEVVRSSRAVLQSSLFADTPVTWIVDRSVSLHDLRELSAELEPWEHFTLADTSDPEGTALAVRFACESRTSTSYVVYTRTGHLFCAMHPSVVHAIRMLDYMPDLGGAFFDARNNCWDIVRPLAGEQDTMEILDALRPRRLSFFENVILRVGLLQREGVIGSVRLLSTFIRSVSYIAGPMGAHDAERTSA